MKISTTRRAFRALTIGAALAVPLAVAGCGGGSTNLPTPGGGDGTLGNPGTRGPAPLASELSGRISYSQSSRGADGQGARTGLIANADGTQIRPYETNGLLSPDGTKIVFSRYNFDTRTSSFYTAAPDGSRRLPRAFDRRGSRHRFVRVVAR